MFILQMLPVTVPPAPKAQPKPPANQPNPQAPAVQTPPSTKGDEFIIKQANPPNKIGDSTLDEIFSSLIKNKTITAPKVNRDNVSDAITEFNALKSVSVLLPLDHLNKGRFYNFMSEYAKNIASVSEPGKNKDALIDLSNEYKKRSEMCEVIANTIRPQLSVSPEKINEIRNYIKEHQMNLSDTLSKLLRDKRFVLIGETHLPVCFGLGFDVGSTLPRLGREARDRKETLIIALERNSELQNVVDRLDYSLNDDELIKKLAEADNEKLPYALKKPLQESINLGLTPGRNISRVLIAAKRAGLKVVCVDTNTTNHSLKPLISNFFEHGFSSNEPLTRLTSAMTSDFRAAAINNALENARDEFMYKNIISQTGPGVRVIFYGGSGHISKTPVVESGMKLNRIGFLLSSRFPGSQIASLRSANWHTGFNYDNTGSSLISLMSDYKSSVVVPTGGPFRTNYGIYDYIVIDPALPSRR